MTRRYAVSLRLHPLLSAALTLMLVATLLAMSPGAARATSAEAATVSEGELTWGIRDSWRTYTMGRATGSQGATVDETNTFIVPVGSGIFDASTGATTIAFDGAVHYQHHCGNIYVWKECALDLKLSGFRVVITPREQVLYATVASRPKAAGNAAEAPAIIEYGEIPFANLDIREATVTTENGVTTWAGVRAYMTADASPSIEYSPGTVLSPLTFSYTGAGGAPDMEERWTPPGTRTVREMTRWVADDADYRQRGAAQSLFIDDANTAVHVVSNAADTGVRLQAHDPATLAPLASQNKSMGSVGPVQAFDPAKGAVFLSERAGAEERTYAFVLDGSVYRKELVATHAVGDVVAAVWDAPGSRLLILVSDFSGPEPRIALEAWSRAGATQWVSERYALPKPPASYPNDAFSHYYLDSAAQSLAVLSDGSLVMGRWEQATRLAFTPDGLVLREVIEAPALKEGFGNVIAGPAGDLWLYSGRQFVQFRLQDDGTLSQSSDVIEGTDTFYQGADVDPVSGLLWAKSQALSELIAVEPAGVVFRQQYDDFSRYAQVIVGPDQIVYSALRNAQLNLGIARFEQVGTSPTVLQHPQSQTARLDSADATAELTLTAEATGTPDADVQWQRRAAGATAFTAIPDARGQTLTIAAGVGDNGAAYRAVFTNRAGALATDAAVITVESHPTVAVHPRSTSVGAGGTVTLSVMPAGSPTPDIAWEVNTGAGWEDIVASDVVVPDRGYLTLSRVQASQTGWSYRARLTSSVGTVYSEVATLTVTSDSLVPTPQDDGSIIGVKNAHGAFTQIMPGIELPLRDDGVKVGITGKGFTQNSNTAGIYVLFGYMATPPSGGASAGNGYDFNPGGGSSGQDGQLFISWPENGETGNAANGQFSSVNDATFTASGLTVLPRFTAQSGATVDCLDGTVVCGVLTIGAHGGADAALETFTPVYFEGQEVPEQPVSPPTPPIIVPPTPPTVPGIAPSVEGSLLWGVKTSFRNYITGNTAKGAISVREGAVSQNGSFWFGQASTDWNRESGTGTTAYRGAVNFTGHSGVLNLTFAYPVVRVDSASRGTLLVTVGGSQVALGDLDLSAGERADVAGGVAYSRVPVTLTASGASVFSYGSSRFYAAGTAMDPISFTVGAAATAIPAGVQTVSAHTATDWTPPADPPATSGLSIAADLVDRIRSGTEITATGEGFEPNETDIKVVLYSDPVILETRLTADADGRATWTGLIPVDTEPGLHTLTFQGSVSRGIPITVRGPAALDGCTVARADLAWGFKESFRSYISGSIAHGDWSVGDGVAYETPEFRWTTSTGTLDVAELTGEVPFSGAVTFTGHDGLLNTTIANPTIRFTGRDIAYLLLDVSGVTMDDALAGNTQNVQTVSQVSFAKLDLAAGEIVASENGAEITLTDVPSAITAAGYAAFPNYEEGTAFDSLDLTVSTRTDCGTPPAASGHAAPAAIMPVRADGDPVAVWVWWAGGGLLAAVAIGAVIAVMRRRAFAAEADVTPEG